MCRENYAQGYFEKGRSSYEPSAKRTPTEDDLEKRMNYLYDDWEIY